MSRFDRRLRPARPDLAAAHLEGQVEAERFVAGTERRVIRHALALRPTPSLDVAQDTEAVFGDRVTIYEEREGWAWGQIARDSYVGWMAAAGLGEPLQPTHRITALRTFIYPAPSIKTPPSGMLSLGSEVAATPAGDFLALADAGFVHAGHAAPVGAVESDPCLVALKFLGTPYLWGGRTSLGLDCSALVQIAFEACGIPCPRDSDMQEALFGEAIALEDADWGDLLFWPGHVALALKRNTIIHANGATMDVALEERAAAIARIGPPSAVKRPPSRRGD